MIRETSYIEDNNVGMMIQKRNLKNRSKGGFTLPELMMSMLAGALLITGSGVALRTMSGLISTSADKANARQNSVNGIKLLRSEVERSMNLLVFGETPSHLPDTDLAVHTNSNGAPTPEDGVVTFCENLASQKNQVFKPIFGIKMVEFVNPVVYGLSTNSAKAYGGDNYGYALVRCGLPLNEQGQYDKESDPYISLILDNIAPMQCLKEKDTCDQLTTIDEISKEERMKLKREILNDLDVTFSPADQASFEPDVFTPYRSYQEPAIRFKTDHSRKVLRFEDPAISTESEDPDNLVNMSYLATENSSQKIYMTAFARADKRLVRKGLDGLTLNGVYFNAKIGGTVRFVVDASGSMRECMLTTNGVCKKTRIESVKDELVQILTDLKNIAPYTKVGISFFSHRESHNHKVWTYNDSSSGQGEQLVVIGSDGALADAERLIGSIQPDGWTEPWDGMDAAFEDPETTTVFLLSDGEPKFNVSNQSKPESRRSVYPELFAAWDISGNQCNTRWWKNDDPINYSTRWPRRWWGEKCWTTTQTSYNDWERIAAYYINQNEERSSSKKMKIHTVAIDLQSNWMEKLSSETGGKHNLIDTQKLMSNNGHGNNSDSCDSSNPSSTFDHCLQDLENKS